jgi:hypothetical protein
MRLGGREHAPNTRVAFRSSSSAQIQPANDPLAQVTAGEPRCHDGIARERRVDRYYDPVTDQFLSVDPMLTLTRQPYAFTRDDPINNTDPLGQIVDQGPGEPIAGNSAASATEADLIEGRDYQTAVTSNSGTYYRENQPPSIAQTVSSGLTAVNNGLNDGFHDVENWTNELPGATSVNNAGFAALPE